MKLSHKLLKKKKNLKFNLLVIMTIKLKKRLKKRLKKKLKKKFQYRKINNQKLHVIKITFYLSHLLQLSQNMNKDLYAKFVNGDIIPMICNYLIFIIFLIFFLYNKFYLKSSNNGVFYCEVLIKLL